MYARLPKSFTKEDLGVYYDSDVSVRVLISRLVKVKVIKKLKDGSYTKLVDSIADIRTY